MSRRCLGKLLLNFFIINGNVVWGGHDWFGCGFTWFTFCFLDQFFDVYIVGICFYLITFFWKVEVLTCKYYFRIFLFFTFWVCFSFNLFSFAFNLIFFISFLFSILVVFIFISLLQLIFFHLDFMPCELCFLDFNAFSFEFDFDVVHETQIKWVSMSGEKCYQWVTETHLASKILSTILWHSCIQESFEFLNAYKKILVSGGPLKVHPSYQDTDALRSKYLLIILCWLHPLTHLKADLYQIQIGIDPWAKV